MTLTRRGHRLVENTAVLALLLALALLLLTAAVIGQDNRCQRLTTQHNPNAAYYCPTSEGTR
jgi:hypothetical protein